MTAWKGTEALTFLKVVLDHGIPLFELLSEAGNQPGVFHTHTFLPLNQSADVLIKCFDFLPRRECPSVKMFTGRVAVAWRSRGPYRG